MASSVTPAKVISRTSNDLDTEYKWGFTIDIESYVIPKGLSEDVVILASLRQPPSFSSAVGASVKGESISCELAQLPQSAGLQIIPAQI